MFVACLGVEYGKHEFRVVTDSEVTVGRWVFRGENGLQNIL